MQIHNSQEGTEFLPTQKINKLNFKYLTQER